jgi:diketogulonate reductase-like aldo/keto reductase
MKIPPIIYGTAWKEERTEDLVVKALKLGFRAIDTANQRKHYYEEGVEIAISKSGIPRKELFLQTKFTYINGQDSRLPYDPDADFKTQVRQSFQSSLEHLKTDYIDSYVLHGPSSRFGIAKEDCEVWSEMESLHKEKKALVLGISNVTLLQLKELHGKAKIKPAFVQNRCFSQLGWDKDIREFCKKNNIIYQGFSLLTANPLAIQAVKDIAKKYKKTPAQIIFRFCMHIGILPLTGTTDEKHMKEDLALDFSLNKDEIIFIENIAAG